MVRLSDVRLLHKILFDDVCSLAYRSALKSGLKYIKYGNLFVEVFRKGIYDQKKQAIERAAYMLDELTRMGNDEASEISNELTRVRGKARSLKYIQQSKGAVIYLRKNHGA